MMGFPNDPTFYNPQETTMTNRHSVADDDPFDEDYLGPFEPGDMATTEDHQIVVCTDHGNWTITQDQALGLIRSLSTMLIHFAEQEA